MWLSLGRVARLVLGLKLWHMPMQRLWLVLRLVLLELELLEAAGGAAAVTSPSCSTARRLTGGSGAASAARED